MAVDLAEMLLTIFINVDIVVFNMFTPWVNFYVGPPYTIPINVWNTTVRVIITRFINSVAPVSDPAFYINVKSNYNRTTLVDGVCTVLTRIICDWTGTDAPCFNTVSTNYAFVCLIDPNPFQLGPQLLQRVQHRRLLAELQLLLHHQQRGNPPGRFYERSL